MITYPKSSTLLRYGDNEPPSHTQSWKIQKALLDEKCLGLKLPTGNKDESGNPLYEQNYVILAPFGPFGPKLFLHGREIFPTKELADKFQEKKFTTEDWEKVMSETLVRKLGKVFAPDTLDQRIIGYSMPQNRVSLVNSAAFKVISDELQKTGAKIPDISGLTYEGMGQLINPMLAKLRQRNPQTPFPATFATSEATAMEDMVKLMKLVEKSGGHAETMLQDQQSPSASMKEAIRAQFKNTMPQLFDAEVANNIKPELQAMAALRKAEVIACSVKHNYDPEVIKHFCIGFNHGNPEDSVEKHIQNGSEFRVGTLIVQAAMALTNPYSEHFLKGEKQVAHTIATSVRPPVVQNILDHKIAIVTADAPNAKVFTDVVGFPETGFGGKYEVTKEHGADAFSNFVVISAPKLGKNRVAYIARHECEHAHDMTHIEPFASFYKGNLQEVLADDRQQLETTYALVKNLNVKSHPAEIKEVKHLANLLKIDGADKPVLSAAELENIKTNVLEALDHIQKRMKTVMPKPKEKTGHVAYDSNMSKMLEAPAVIEELNAVLGKDFTRKVLPRLQEACRYHHNSHPAVGGTPG